MMTEQQAIDDIIEVTGILRDRLAWLEQHATHLDLRELHARAAATARLGETSLLLAPGTLAGDPKPPVDHG